MLNLIKLKLMPNWNLLPRLSSVQSNAPFKLIGLIHLYDYLIIGLEFICN